MVDGKMKGARERKIRRRTRGGLYSPKEKEKWK